MRHVIWILLLLLLAALAAVGLSQLQGVVVLVWPPYRVELSMPLFIAAVLGAVLVLYALLRGVRALLQLPKAAKAWRQAHALQEATLSILQAQHYLEMGRYSRAFKAATGAAKGLSGNAAQWAAQPTSLQALLVSHGHRIAAQAAHALQDHIQRTAHAQLLQAAVEVDVRAPWAALPPLLIAQWALDDRDGKAAMQALNSLPAGLQRRTLMLKLRLRAAQMMRDHTTALDTGRLLVKHNAFSSYQGQVLLDELVRRALTDAPDEAAMIDVWRKLTPPQQRQPRLAAQAAKRLQTLGASAAIRLSVMSESLQHWQQQHAVEPESTSPSDLIVQLAAAAQGMDSAWLQRIERLHTQRPHDVQITYLAGMACLARQLWGKANLLLQQASQRMDASHPFYASLCLGLAQCAEQAQQPDQAAHWTRMATRQLSVDPFHAV